jgi:hypothetical protein
MALPHFALEQSSAQLSSPSSVLQTPLPHCFLQSLAQLDPVSPLPHTPSPQKQSSLHDALDSPGSHASLPHLAGAI